MNKQQQPRRFLPPMTTSISTGPFPGDGQTYTIGPDGKSLMMPSYYAVVGSAAAVDIDSSARKKSPAPSPTAASPAVSTFTPASATNQSPAVNIAVAAEASPKNMLGSPAAAPTVNWFSKDNIDQHFPLERGFGGRWPPVSWRGSEPRMKVWRRLNRREQDEEWARWNSLKPSDKNSKTDALEELQMGRISSSTCSKAQLLQKIALTFDAGAQTDESLLDMRDEDDEAVVERLTKRVKVQEATKPAAAAATAATTSPPTAGTKVAANALPTSPINRNRNPEGVRPSAEPNMRTPPTPRAYAAPLLQEEESDYQRIQREEWQRHLIRFLS